MQTELNGWPPSARRCCWAFCVSSIRVGLCCGWRRLLRPNMRQLLTPPVVLVVTVKAANNRRNSCNAPIPSRPARNTGCRNTRTHKGSKTIRRSAVNAQPCVEARDEKHHVAERGQDEQSAFHCDVAAQRPGSAARGQGRPVSKLSPNPASAGLRGLEDKSCTIIASFLSTCAARTSARIAESPKNQGPTRT